MKKLCLILGLICQPVSAQNFSFHPWDDPARVFSFPKMEKKINVTVVTVDDVNKACAEEYKKIGVSVGFSMNSCAVFDLKEAYCKIIMPRKLTMHVLGHEMLHCIKGQWH